MINTKANIKNLTPEIINQLSYTDFIGLVNQWNVLPGAYSTLSKWIQYSKIDKSSNILEVACTTGFSSREIADMTKCTGVGIDISGSSIEQAKYNLKQYSPNSKIQYIHIDGYEFEPQEKFSHIIFGAALRFFPNPEKMLRKSISMLNDGGYILSSEFYVKKPIPQTLANKAKTIFGINITQVGYKEVMKIYEGLEIIYEDKNDLTPETKEELYHYCKSTIDRAVKRLEISNNNLYSAMFNRLFAIKDMSNQLRPYQQYNVLVCRYRSLVYPNRFIELF